MLWSLVKGVDWLVVRIGKGAAGFSVLLMLTMTYEVTVRYVFNRPTFWSYDITYMMGGTFFVFLASYALLRDWHVRVDIFYARFSRRVRSILDAVLISLLLFPAVTVIAIQAWKFAFLSLAQGEVSAVGVWEPTVVPFRFAAALGFSLLALEGVAWFIRELFFATTGKDLVTSKEIGGESHD